VGVWSVVRCGGVSSPPRLWVVEGNLFTYGQVPEVAGDARALDWRDPGLIQDLIALIDLARRVGLGRTRVVYPTATAGGVGEIRLNVRGLRYRLYFAQPTPPPMVLGLCFAVKLPHGHPDARDAQNADIERAARRYRDWLVHRETSP